MACSDQREYETVGGVSREPTDASGLVPTMDEKTGLTLSRSTWAYEAEQGGTCTLFGDKRARPGSRGAHRPPREHQR